MKQAVAAGIELLSADPKDGGIGQRHIDEGLGDVRPTVIEGPLGGLASPIRRGRELQEVPQAERGAQAG